MEFRLLGPLEVRNAGSLLPVRGSKVRAVLAVLLLNAGKPVNADRMATALWGEDAPPEREKTVHVHVSRLRSALGDQSVILTTPAGYCLRAAPGELDSERFEGLVGEAREALRAGLHERASALLREGEGLWRGPPLADLGFATFAQGEIARLEELRVAALELRIDADLAGGRHEELIPELRQHVREHPTRERFAAQLMLGLYRCGRQDDALDVFWATRAALIDRGLEPGRELLQRQQQILERAAELTLPPACDVLPAADDVPPPLRAASEAPPVGRERERAELQTAMAVARSGRCRTVLVCGEPGIGKTRLAALAALEAHRAGFAVSWTAAVDGVEAPYGLWIDAIRQLLQRASPRAVATLREEHGSVLAGLVRGFGHRAPGHVSADWADRRTARHQLFAAFLAALEGMAAERPLLVVLDDLQWADAESLTLLKYVTARGAGLPLLVVATYRGSDLQLDDPRRDTLIDVRSSDGVEERRLEGLADSDVAARSSAARRDGGAFGRRAPRSSCRPS
jgi:DNA-binding SARP family transcriptional activator